MPSWIISNETNCPVVPLDAAAKVLFPASVTFATSEVEASQDIVDSSVSVASA